jgi:hypothetical protein
MSDLNLHRKASPVESVMSRVVSGSSSRKGVPLDLFGSAAESHARPKPSDAIKTPWLTHRAGISQTSSAWSTIQCSDGQQSNTSHNHYAGSTKGRSSSAISSSDFPSLSTSKLAEAGATIPNEEGKRSGVCILSSAVVQGTSAEPTSVSCILIRDCVRELRRLFPNADRDVLEDATASIAISLKSDLCLRELVEQVVSQLLDVFADNPGIRCAFPKFPIARPILSGEPASWKDKVGCRTGFKQKNKSSSFVTPRSSDLDFYQAAIDSLTDKSYYQGAAESQERAVSKTLCGVHSERLSGTRLRMQSHQIAESRAQLFAEAARAFIAGDSKLAKELSSRGHELTSEFHELSVAAAENIFLSKNPSLDEGVIDLHGLHRDEAFDAVTRFIEHLRMNPPKSSLGSPLVVCGKGIHSKGAPVLQATAKEALASAGCTFHVLPGGSGTLAITHW